MGSGGTVPRILDVVTGLRRMVSFTSRQVYSPDDIAGTYGVGVWVIPVAVLDAVDKKKGLFLCKESNSDWDMTTVSNELCVVFEVISHLLRETEANLKETWYNQSPY
jgi:CO dehydrogenase/acetyl-CoA synthase alpha subunit